MNALAKVYFGIFLAVLLSSLAGCGYNVRDVQLPGSKQVMKAVPEDIVFSAGLTQSSALSSGDFTVAVAKMPGDMIAELRSYRVAWHHVVAYNAKTHKPYVGQVFYLGKMGGFLDGIPCGRYLSVIIEGLSPIKTSLSDIRVAFANTHADKWFDLNGQPIPFTQAEYETGKWEKIGQLGTPLNKAIALQSTDEVRRTVASWTKYPITDAGDVNQKWMLITPYRPIKGEPDLIKTLAKKNEKYSVGDKILEAGRTIVLSPDYYSIAASILLSAARTPFIKGELEEVGVDEIARMAERLDAESGACSSIMVAVPR